MTNSNIEFYNYYYIKINDNINSLNYKSDYDSIIYLLKHTMNLLKEFDTKIENYDMKNHIIQFKELYRDVEDELKFCKTKKYYEKWYIINNKIEKFIHIFFVKIKEHLKIV